MDNVHIRPARPADAAPLGQVIADAYAPHAASIPDLPDVAGGLAEDIAESIVLVAEIAGRIVGGMILLDLGDHLKLANIAASPVAAGQGLASTLLEHATKAALARGYHCLRLNTHGKMAANIRFYEKRGWVETGRSGMTVMMERRL